MERCICGQRESIMKAIIFFLCIELIASSEAHPANGDLPRIGATVPALNLELSSPESRGLQSNWQPSEWITPRPIFSTAKVSIATMSPLLPITSVLRTPSLPCAGVNMKPNPYLPRVDSVPVNAPQPLTRTNSSSIRKLGKGVKKVYSNTRAFAIPYVRPILITPPKVLPTVDAPSPPPLSTVSQSQPIVLYRIPTTPPSTSHQNAIVAPSNLVPLPEDNYLPSGFATEYTVPPLPSQENTPSLNLLTTGQIKDDGGFVTMTETNPKNVALPHVPELPNDSIRSYGTDEVPAENTRPPIPSQGSGPLNIPENIMLMKQFPSNAMNTTEAITMVEQPDPDPLPSLTENYQATISPVVYPISTPQQSTQTLISMPVHHITDGQFLASPENKPGSIALTNDLEPLNWPSVTNPLKEVPLEYPKPKSTPLTFNTLPNLSVIELMNKLFTSASTATQPNTMAIPSNPIPVASPTANGQKTTLWTGKPNKMESEVTQQNTPAINCFPVDKIRYKDQYFVIYETLATPNESRSSNYSMRTITPTDIPTDKGKLTATSQVSPEKLDPSMYQLLPPIPLTDSRDNQTKTIAMQNDQISFTKSNCNNSLNGLSIHLSLTLQMDYDIMSTTKSLNSTY